jgi:ATP-dependent DNA ligase
MSLLWEVSSLLDEVICHAFLDQGSEENREARADLVSGVDRLKRALSAQASEFVAITDALRALPFRRVMLDGEAVAHCLDGLPHFHKLLSGDGQATACLYALDLLWQDARDLRGVELIGRRRMLAKALKKAVPALRFSEHMAGAAGEAMFRHACAMGLEGIVSKRVASRYKSGSCLSWVKVKNPEYERRSGAALA